MTTVDHGYLQASIIRAIERVIERHEGTAVTRALVVVETESRNKRGVWVLTSEDLGGYEAEALARMAADAVKNGRHTTRLAP